MVQKQKSRVFVLITACLVFAMPAFGQEDAAAKSSGRRGEIRAAEVEFQRQRLSVPTVVSDTAASDDPKTCTLNFGWGHTYNVKPYRDNKHGEQWLVQGCNIGPASRGELAGRGRYQDGPNGAWFALMDIDWNSSNSGLMLFDLKKAIPKLKNGRDDAKLKMKYYYMGFVRMTEWNYLDLVDYAIGKLNEPNPKCATMTVKFRCLALEQGDDYMGTRQFKHRLDASTKEIIISQISGNAGLSALNRFASLGDCLEDVVGSARVYPEECGQEITLKKSSKISERCKKWYSEIAVKYEEWNRTTTSRPLPDVTSYPETGPIY